MVINALTQETENERTRDPHDRGETKIFGFWIYLMSDCILFCCLFATYAVLLNGTAGGPSGKDIFELSSILMQTILLLLSSNAYGMATISASKNNTIHVISWLVLAFLFAFIFVCMEMHEFYSLIERGFGPDRSGFLSAFFTLVGVHNLHVISGLFWMVVLIFQIIIRNLNRINCIRIICLKLFWHFIEIIWICVFSFVYLMGVV